MITIGTGMGGFAFPFLIGKLLDDHGERAFSLRLRWIFTDPSVVSMLGFATMCRVWAGMTAVVFLLAIKFTSPRVPLRKPIGIRPKWFAIDLKTINHPIVWTMVSSAWLSMLESIIFPPLRKRELMLNPPATVNHYIHLVHGLLSH